MREEEEEEEGERERERERDAYRYLLLFGRKRGLKKNKKKFFSRMRTVACYTTVVIKC